MITIRLGGGLGNQMFQYAFGRSLANKRGDDLRLDVSDYAANTVAGAHTRLYGLSNFNITAGTVSPEEARRLRARESSLTKRILRRIEGSILGRNRIKFEPFTTKNSRDAYIEGYWQSYKYFPEMREVLLQEFSLKTPLSPGATAIAESIRNSPHPVSVHVRRGDYVESAEARRHYGECGQAYYSQAVAEISDRRQRPLTIFVFSDDISWVKQNLSFPANTQYVAENSAPDYERMHLMSLCQDNIIANSTFSWWGAWLNPKIDKVVVGPTPWIPGIDLPADDILPPEWIQVPQQKQ